MRNTGKPSEADFEALFSQYGKLAHIERLVDSSEVHGRNKGKSLNVRKAIADYIVTLKGDTFYAEVKSTSEKTSFRFSMISIHQKAKAAMVTLAGGVYLIFATNLNTGKWYAIPYQVIRNNPKQSMKWDELGPYEWKV